MKILPKKYYGDQYSVLNMQKSQAVSCGCVYPSSLAAAAAGVLGNKSGVTMEVAGILGEYPGLKRGECGGVTRPMI